MQYIFMALAVLGIVGADQLSKWWVIHNIFPSFVKPENLLALGVPMEELAQLPKEIPVIDGFFHLSHFHNEGAAWSSFEGMIWLFCLVFAVFTGFLVWEFVTRKMGFSTFEKWCLVAVYGGGLGNMIDRVRLGFVVDMIELEFINFPIFNVADCFITCGCIAFIVHLVFFNKKFWKEEKK